MDGLPNRPTCPIVRTACAGILLVTLGGCVSLEEIAVQSGADPVTWEIIKHDALACHAPADADHTHPPGDPGWVGHNHRELVAALGPPTFQIGKPRYVSDGPDYLVAVYAEAQAARSGCFDTYARNPCGVITGYYCR